MLRETRLFGAARCRPVPRGRAGVTWPRRRAQRLAALVVLPLVGGCSEQSGGGGGSPQPECSIEGQTRECYPGEPATLGLGPCHAGTSTCHDGSWSACDGAVLPTVESCNEQDDDCNGVVDEGCGCEDGQERVCYGGPPATRGVGACSDGVQRCSGSLWQQDCEGQTLPDEESCDTLDNDCNGIADELDCACINGQTQSCYGGSAATLGVGPCHAGLQSCDDGVWSPVCEGDVVPATEACNDADDDCDGHVDENNPGGGGSCQTGLPGPCAAGSRQCVSGELECVSTTGPTSEDCDNGVDDDCDGDIDCGYDDDCDGQAGPEAPNGLSSTCRATLPTCTNSVACDTCYYFGGEHRWCRRVHGAWQWIPMWLCDDDAMCEATCCAGSDHWCDGNGVWLSGIAPSATCPTIPPNWYCP